MRQKTMLAGLPILVALAGGGVFVAHNMMVKAWVDGVAQVDAGLPDGWHVTYADMTVGFLGQSAEFTNVTVTKGRETIATLAKIQAGDFGFRSDSLTIGMLDGSGLKMGQATGGQINIANFTIKGFQFPVSIALDVEKLSIAELRGQDLTYNDGGGNAHLDWFQGFDLKGKNLRSIVVKKFTAKEKSKLGVDGGTSGYATVVSANQISARELTLSSIIDQVVEQNFDVDDLGPVTIDDFLLETDRKKMNAKSIDMSGIKKHRVESLKILDLIFEVSNSEKTIFNIHYLEGKDIDNIFFLSKYPDILLSKKLGFLDLSGVNFTSDLGNGSFDHFNMTDYEDRRLTHAALHDFFLSTQGTITTIADQTLNNVDFRAINNKDSFFNGGFDLVTLGNARFNDLNIINGNNNFSLDLLLISDLKNGFLDNLKLNNFLINTKTQNMIVNFHSGFNNLGGFSIGAYLNQQKGKHDFKPYDVFLSNDLQFTLTNIENRNQKIKFSSDHMSSTVRSFDDNRHGYAYKNSIKDLKFEINSDHDEIARLIELAKTDSVILDIDVDGLQDFDQRLARDNGKFHVPGFFDLDFDLNIGNITFINEDSPNFLLKFYDPSQFTEKYENKERSFLQQKLIKESFHYHDDGLIKRLIDIGLPGQMPEQVAETVQKNGRQVAGLLGLDGEQTASWGDAMAAVIRGQGDLEITASPTEPLPLASLYDPEQTLQHKLDLLGVSIKAVPAP